MRAPRLVAGVPLRSWLGSFRPRPARYRAADYARGALGALVGIVVAGAVARQFAVGPDALPFIVAPIGASAVLVFAAPASPLAQPWPLLVGNMSSAAVGITSAKLIDDTLLAAALAVGAAIALMMMLRCLHPPGGACALFAAVGAKAVQDQGYAFAIWPIGVNSAFLLLVALAVNNLTGRHYPHIPEVETAQVTAGTDPAPSHRVGVQTTDIERAMSRLDQGLDIMPADVMVLLHDAEANALDRRLGDVRCSTIMARDVQVVYSNDTLYRARLLINQHHVKALPVIDSTKRVIGIVTVFDLFNLDIAELAPVETVMSAPVTTVRDETPVSQLIGLMTDRGLHHLPVVDADSVLVGIVTRSELITVLNRALLGPADAS